MLLNILKFMKSTVNCDRIYIPFFQFFRTSVHNTRGSFWGSAPLDKWNLWVSKGVQAPTGGEPPPPEKNKLPHGQISGQDRTFWKTLILYSFWLYFYQNMSSVVKPCHKRKGMDKKSYLLVKYIVSMHVKCSMSKRFYE